MAHQKSALLQDQKLHAVWGPLDAEGDCRGGQVGFMDVTEIVVGQCRGPVGWYDVAVIKRDNGGGDYVVPLHMAEIVIMAPNEGA